MPKYNIAGFRNSSGRQVDLEGGGKFLNSDAGSYRGPLNDPDASQEAIDRELRTLRVAVITTGEGEGKNYITIYEDSGFRPEELDDLTDYYAEIYE